MEKAYLRTFSLSHFIICILAINIILINSSCTSTKKNVVYFENIKRDTTLTNLVTKDFELKIQKGDLLNINISSKDPTLTVPFNAVAVGSTGYLVDNTGYIDFLFLGKIKAEGLTRDQLKEYLKNKLEPDYL